MKDFPHILLIAFLLCASSLRAMNNSDERYYYRSVLLLGHFFEEKGNLGLAKAFYHHFYRVYPLSAVKTVQISEKLIKIWRKKQEDAKEKQQRLTHDLELARRENHQLMETEIRDALKKQEQLLEDYHSSIREDKKALKAAAKLFTDNDELKLKYLEYSFLDDPEVHIDKSRLFSHTNLYYFDFLRRWELNPTKKNQYKAFALYMQLAMKDNFLAVYRLYFAFKNGELACTVDRAKAEELAKLLINWNALSDRKALIKTLLF